KGALEWRTGCWAPHGTPLCPLPRRPHPRPLTRRPVALFRPLGAPHPRPRPQPSATPAVKRPESPAVRRAADRRAGGLVVVVDVVAVGCPRCERHLLRLVDARSPSPL